MGTRNLDGKEIIQQLFDSFEEKIASLHDGAFDKVTALFNERFEERDLRACVICRMLLFGDQGIFPIACVKDHTGQTVVWTIAFDDDHEYMFYAMFDMDGNMDEVQKEINCDAFLDTLENLLPEAIALTAIGNRRLVIGVMEGEVKSMGSEDDDDIYQLEMELHPYKTINGRMLAIEDLRKEDDDNGDKDA